MSRPQYILNMVREGGGDWAIAFAFEPTARDLGCAVARRGPQIPGASPLIRWTLTRDQVVVRDVVQLLPAEASA